MTRRLAPPTLTPLKSPTMRKLTVGYRSCGRSAARDPRSLRDIRVGLDLHEHLRGDQAADLHHAGCGSNLSEKRPVRASHILPGGDVEHVDTRANHVAQ